MTKRFYIKRTSNDEVEYFEGFDEAQERFVQLVDEYLLNQNSKIRSH